MDPSPLTVPPSFVDLFVPQGRLRPAEPLAWIAERHELCEDMASMLAETARERRLDLGVAEEDVLVRVLAGLLVEGSPVSGDEATWVACRVAEMLHWPLPEALRERVRPATLARMRHG